MKKKAFVVYVFGFYEKYIPYYIYFINKNYPEDDILVFFQGTLSDYVHKSCDNFKNHTLYENVYPEHKNIKGGGPRLLRYVLSRDYLKNYEFVYIGDVDILILKEEINLFTFHKNQALWQMENLLLPLIF